MIAAKTTLVLEKDINVDSVIQKISENSNNDEPFYICDVSELISRVERWRKLLPRVEIFYAVKCNSSRVVLETFAALNTGFDCATKEEMRRITALRVPPSKIIYSHTTKHVDHLTYAAKIGVTAMTFDNELELHKIKKHHPKAELLIRMKYDDSSALITLGKKFGVLPGTEARHLLEVAKSLDLNVIGVHFHVGFGSANYTIYYDAIASARQLFDIGSDLGYRFKLLDIGGGYPGVKGKQFDEITKFINRGLDEYFPDDTVKIIAEPGQYCCNTAFKLVSQVHSKNVVKDADKEKIMNYYVDVSVFNPMFNVIHGSSYNCRPLKYTNKIQVYPSIIWGPTSDVRDKISKNFDHLPELDIGDWIMFNEIGAYSPSLSSEYNGFPPPGIHSVIKRGDWLMLTKNVPKPISSDRFTTSLEILMKERDIPYSFRQKYF